MKPRARQPQAAPRPAPAGVAPRALDTFEVKLTFLSDWHVGKGVGRPGDLHALILRDDDQFPYVPAKTLTGIWRDACERVALGLDGPAGQDRRWQRWVEFLFGDTPGEPTDPEAHQNNLATPRPAGSFPRPAALSLRPALLPERLRAALRTAPRLLPSLTFVKPGVSIDPRSGSAREDFLRFEEMARGGISLSTQGALQPQGTPDQRVAATALLLAGARLVERLGGKRRRGQGRCRLVVAGIEDINPWLNWIERHTPPPPPDLVCQADGCVPRLAPLVDGWLQLELRLTAAAPLLIPKRATGHLIRGLDHIPGTYLLPLISQRLSGLGVDLRGALAHGDLVVTHAYIEIGGQRGVPAPLALGRDKKKREGLERGLGVYNVLVEQTEGLQLKAERGYIAADEEPLPAWCSVHLRMSAHNTIYDQTQRPTTEVGGLYHYEAIPQATRLRVQLRLRQSLGSLLTQRDATWWKKLTGPCSLGRSKKDDYGEVKIEALAAPAAHAPKVTVTPRELCVWLLSPMLLRDARLRPCASVGRLGEVLGERLGLTLRPRDSGSEGTRSEVQQTSRVDTWHTRWGLPRPSLVGLGAGTCVVFTVTGGDLDPRALGQLESSGLGERRAEGYGQVRFNDPLLSQVLFGKKRSLDRPSDSEEKPVPLKADDPSVPYARLVEMAAWRGVLHRACLAAVSTSEKRRMILGIEQNRPTMSQLAALRSILSRVQTLEDGGLISAWLARLRETPSRSRQWPSGALVALEKLATDGDHVYAVLNLDPKNQDALPVCTEQGAGTLKRLLWAESLRTLISACIQAHKRELEPSLRGRA